MVIKVYNATEGILRSPNWCICFSFIIKVTVYKKMFVLKAVPIICCFRKIIPLIYCVNNIR